MTTPGAITAWQALRADEAQLTSVGRMTNLQVHSLTTLQLSALLGDHAMFKHILRKQCSILWVWGPVTQYSSACSALMGRGALIRIPPTRLTPRVAVRCACSQSICSALTRRAPVAATSWNSSAGSGQRERRGSCSWIRSCKASSTSSL